MTILALIVIPLMIAGVIWGILGDFDESSSVATPVPTQPIGIEATPSPSGTPAALFVIVEGA